MYRDDLCFEKHIDNISLPDGVNIWVDIAFNDSVGDAVVKIGYCYESAMAITVDDNNPLPIEALGSPDSLSRILSSYNISPSCWSASRTFIMDHAWLLRETCHARINSWTIELALLVEERIGRTLSYDWYANGSEDRLYLFESDLGYYMKRFEISTDISFFDDSPALASSFTLPLWSDDFLDDAAMDNIFRYHTMLGRIWVLLGDSDNKANGVVTESLGISDNNYDTLKRAILSKIDLGGALPQFTKKEREMIDCILAKLNRKDLFPDRMTARQIRAAIRSAYGNARRSGGPIRPGLREWINAYGITDRRPCLLFQGESGGLTINFWFVYDELLIAKAYPVKIGSSVAI